MTAPVPVTGSDRAAVRSCLAAARAAAADYTDVTGTSAIRASGAATAALLDAATAACLAVVDALAAVAPDPTPSPTASPSPPAAATPVASPLGASLGILAQDEDVLVQTCAAQVVGVSDPQLRHLLGQVAAAAGARLATWRTLAVPGGAVPVAARLAVAHPSLATLPEAVGRAGFPDAAVPDDRALTHG